jgi:hypothetical protein
VTPTATPTLPPAFGGEAKMRQAVYAGASLWTRDSNDTAGEAWPTAWATQTYASAWGTNTNHPSTSHIDSVTIRVFFNDNNLVRHHMRQAIYVNGSPSGTFYYRDSTDNNGTSWPTTWQPVTYASSWGSDGNHPPITTIDSAVIRPLYDSQGRQTNMRQAIYAGSTMWYRDSTDRAGTQWPTTWGSIPYGTSIGSAWEGSNPVGTPPPNSGISEVVFRPVYNATTGALTKVRQTVYVGNMYYTRDSTDPTAGSWGVWSSLSYSLAWGGTGNPPTTSIDAFMVRPVYPVGGTLAIGAPQSGGVSKPAAAPQTLSLQSLPLQTRVITYAYDGLLRLTGAAESPGTSYTYAYDLAGNRTDGGRTYNAANQVNGFTYDNAGNLTGDSTATYAYDDDDVLHFYRRLFLNSQFFIFNSHGRAHDPRVELLLADALGLAQAGLARRDGYYLLEDLAPNLLDARSLQHAAGVDIHVAAHAIVGHAVGGDLDARRGLEAEAAAATGGEGDDIAAAGHLPGRRDWVVAGCVHVGEAARCYRLGILVDRLKRCAAAFRHRAERFLVDRGQAAGLVAMRGIIVDLAALARGVRLPPADALDQLLADRAAGGATRQ